MPEKKERTKGFDGFPLQNSFHYSSLGAGYAPRDVRRKINIY
jgi:hypothetical protein